MSCREKASRGKTHRELPLFLAVLRLEKSSALWVFESIILRQNSESEERTKRGRALSLP